MLSLTRQEPWFANFLLTEARNYRSRGIREIQAGAWPVGTVFDSAGNVVTPATVDDARSILLAPFFDEQRAPALLIMRDAEINDSYVQYGVLDRNRLNNALVENSRIIVRAGPMISGLEASDVTVRPPVAGYGDVQSVLEYFDRDMLRASGAVMTGPLQLIEVDGSAPRTQAVNKGYVDSLVLGIASYIGRLNAAINEVHYTPISGIMPSPAPLVAPDIAGPGRYVVCEVAGIMPDDAWLGGTAFSYGDYAMSDGETWYHLPFRTEQVTGTMVALTPPVLGRDNAQGALEVTEARLANTVAKTGDTMTGMLTINPGFPGLPPLTLRAQPGDMSAAALYISGNPTGEAARIEGNIEVITGSINLRGDGAITTQAGFIMSRQYYLGVTGEQCAYLLGPDASSGGLWRNNLGQMTLRRPAGHADIFSEDSNAITRHRILTELDRAPPVIIEPNAATAQPGGAWINFWSGSYPIPRGGNSRVLLTVSITGSDLIGAASGLCIGGVRGFSGAAVGNTPERRLFVYKAVNAMNTETVALHIDVTGFNPSLTVEIRALEPAGPPTAYGFTTVGGDPNNPLRSQILITDLGPR